jgi:hypothetical protein
MADHADCLAHDLLKQKGQPIVYTPGKWWLIMMVIKHLPAVIFNKLNI